MNKKIQIGVMGSDADLNFGKSVEEFAQELGKLIAKNDAILVYGAESDCNSISTIAAKSAKDNGGITVGVACGKSKKIWGDDMPTVLIPSGLGLGGGREFTLVLSCDVIIAVSGGSGTLTEIAIAYQANIPIVTVDNLGGWAEKLSDTYLDARNRLKCVSAKTPQEAVEKAIMLAKRDK